MQPVFLDNSTSNPNRKFTWEAYGTLCGLYLARLATGPLPVSPFLIMTALLSLFGPDSDQKFNYLGNKAPSVYGSDPRYLADILLPMTELSHLAAYDPDLTRDLQPWIQLQWNEPVPSDFTHPVRQFIIEVLDKNVWCSRCSHTWYYLSHLTASFADHRGHELSPECHFSECPQCMAVSGILQTCLWALW